MNADALRERLIGFDVDGALARLGNMEELYVEVLGSFCDEQAETIPAVRAAIGGGDSDGAKRLVHTLKGLAGTIGATSLEASAVALEHGITEGTSGPGMESLIDACEGDLNGAMTAIRALG